MQERADGYAEYARFAQQLTERGHRITGGAELKASTTARTVQPGGATVTDGPYAESAEQVGGYYVVETSDPMDLAKVCGRLFATPFHQAVEIRQLVEGM